MAEPVGQGAGASGPGNKVIATTLLEALAVRGRSAVHTRATRALGEAGTNLAAASPWLGDHAIAALFGAAEVEPGLARAIGHRLVAPDATGLKLYGLGLATPEKAYRRVQSLLPRDATGARWAVDSIAGRCAELAYHASPDVEAPDRVARALCALRRGMLEAIPGLYGLLPAGVDEKSCVADGADACRYAVRWQVTPRRGAWTGAAIGVGLAAGIGVASAIFGGLPFVAGGGVTAIGVIAGCALLTAPVLGAALDLRRQLEAVAGARRGHLALFDQVDDALAAKLDALARADAKLDADPQPSPVRSNAAATTGRSEEVARALRHAAHEIHAAAGDLECFFDAHDKERGFGDDVSDERGRVRDIREWSARIVEHLAGSGRTPVDLGRLVERAVAAARPGLVGDARVSVECEPGLAPFPCEPVQIEHVVVQLVRNAVEASVELTTAPEVVVGVRETPGGVELSVEDRGVGIESTEVDEVFDPFFGERPPGAGGGLGLPVCLRIAERHGGALRIENQARAGTRVTVLLPRDAERDDARRKRGIS